jgi:hypothetical protein
MIIKHIKNEYLKFISYILYIKDFILLIQFFLLLNYFYNGNGMTFT